MSRRSDATDGLLKVSTNGPIDLGLEFAATAIYSGDRINVALTLELGNSYIGLSVRDQNRGVQISKLGYFYELTGE